MKKVFKKIALLVPGLKKVIIDRDNLVIERNHLVDERSELIVERDSLAVEKKELQVERDSLELEKNNLITERDSVLEEIQDHVASKERLTFDNDQLNLQNQSLMEERDLAVNQRNSLASQKEELLTKIQTANPFVPPGHFYSPIPSLEEVKKDEEIIWAELPEKIEAIDLNTEEQLLLLEEFEEYYNTMPFKDKKSKGLRYYFQNPAYSYSDGIFTHCMIRHAKPKNIIEVGSGFSSCLTLDTNDMFFNGEIKCSFIEPYPDLLKSLVKKSDISSVEIYESRLQEVSIELFKELKANDILFIDSTHISKINSDVNYIIHEILPVLPRGVFVHFHDIFYPFEYPKNWVLEGRAWNEQYILRAFLEHNKDFKIVMFNTYLQNMHKEKLEKRFPLIFNNTGASIWVQRV